MKGYVFSISGSLDKPSSHNTYPFILHFLVTIMITSP